MGRLNTSQGRSPGGEDRCHLQALSQRLSWDAESEDDSSESSNRLIHETNASLEGPSLVEEMDKKVDTAGEILEKLLALTSILEKGRGIWKS